MEKLLEILKKYKPTNKEKENKSAEKCFNMRNKIIKAFEDDAFELSKNVQKKTG